MTIIYRSSKTVTALMKYGRHLDSCRTRDWTTGEHSWDDDTCNCGLREAVSSVHETLALPQLQRIDKAARAFVDAFDCDAVYDYLKQECWAEWTELNDALFNGLPVEPSETSVPHIYATTGPCHVCGGQPADAIHHSKRK